MVTFSKRDVLLAPAAAFGVGMTSRALGASRQDTLQDHQLKVAPGRFKPTVESLKAYRTPEWFRDAKLGIWSHWGPQAVPRRGDWYARFMYVPGHPHYDHHVKTYGHPSEFGYKDILPLWKAEKFDPDALMDRYAAAGAKYFVSMGVHHDNFDLWNSRHHRWNAAAMGPKRDIVGAWKAAAKRRGLRFGVSEHLGASYTWWHPNHLYDQFSRSWVCATTVRIPDMPICITTIAMNRISIRPPAGTPEMRNFTPIGSTGSAIWWIPVSPTFSIRTGGCPSAT